MSERPSRLSAAPGQVNDWLRQHFAEDVVLRYQQVIGSIAVEEAARDLRTEANGRAVSGDAMLQGTVATMLSAARMIEYNGKHGSYPGQLLCPHHRPGHRGGFGPCSGYPWCWPGHLSEETETETP